MKLPITKQQALDAAALIFISLIFYWLGFQLQAQLFKFTESIPGVNWFYIPSGLRVVIILIANLYGAIGIFIATILIDILYYEDITGYLLIFTAISSAGSAYIALIFIKIWNAKLRNIDNFNYNWLLNYAIIYSIINSLMHQISWTFFKREGVNIFIDIWPMFIGDLLGAAAFLLALGLILKFKNRM